jgi:REP element-mobilizing transposase RayT
MARPLRIQYPGAYYYVSCRGIEQKKIFRNTQDQKIFLEKLSLSLDIYDVSLLAYVCMPKHFHLLVNTPKGNLSEFMRHFNVSYTSVFNRRHRRAGNLYQGRYKAFLIDADHYLLEVSRYIHIIPLLFKAFSKRGVKEKWDALLRHKPSSLLGFFSIGKRMGFINYKPVLDYLGRDDRKGRQRYRQFIKKGIEQQIENPLELGKGDGIVGAAEFIKSVKREFLEGGVSKRVRPAWGALNEAFKPEEFIEHFARLIRRRKGDICRRGEKSLERKMLMELLYRLCQMTQPEIGRLVGGIDYSAVSRARKILQVRMDREPKLKQRFDQLGDQLLQLSR